MSLTDPRWVDVNVEGETTGVQYTGRFQLKPFLKVFETTDAMLLAQKYGKGIDTTTNHGVLLNALAFLKYHVLASEATWWVNDGLDLLDQAPIYEIANKLTEFQQELKPKKAETPAV